MEPKLGIQTPSHSAGLHLSMRLRKYGPAACVALFISLFASSANGQQSCAETKHRMQRKTTKSGTTSLAPIDILHQRIELDLTQGNIIRGACRIRSVPRVDGLASFDLHLEALAVDSVTTASGTWPHHQNGTILTITPTAGLTTLDTVEFTVHYGGDPVVDPSGFGGFYTTAALTYNLGVAFESVPHSYGRTWFPCLDNFTERSTYEFFIRTAGGRKAWCNGSLVERIALGGDTLINHWLCQGSMPAYLVSVAAANHVVARDTLPTLLGGGVPVELVAAAHDTAAMRASFIHMSDAFAHFEDLFGPYRWEKVGYVLTTQGAMEHSTSIHYPAWTADGTLEHETTMAHELAHHWFGNLVTCERAEEMYINEGFSEYLSHLFLERVYGHERYMAGIRSNHRSMVQRAHRVDQGWWALSEMPQEWTYGTHSYNKGADVLHSLRSYMGDEAFSEGLKSFLGTYAFQPVNTAMLRDHLSMTSGLDMTDFFADWIEQPGWAAFEIDAQRVTPGEDGWDIQLTIGQKQRGPSAPYNNVPITIAIIGIDTDNVYRDTVMVGGTTTEVALTVPFEPAFVWLNDDERLSLASTGSTYTVTSTVTISSTQANFELRPRAGGPTLVRMEQYWVAADEGPFAAPSGYVLSPDRYWRLTGNWTDASRFGGRIVFDGRDNINTLDPGLMRDTMGFSFHEDSLVLLYRSSPDAVWIPWSGTISNMGSATDGYGRIDIDSVATGEYTLAWRTGAVGIGEDHDRHTASIIGPNPAHDGILIDMVKHVPYSGYLLVVDGLGRTVLRDRISGQHVRLRTLELAEGAYTITLEGSGGRNSTIGRFVVRH